MCSVGDCGARREMRGAVAVLAGVLGVAEVQAQGRLQVGGRPPKTVDLGVCSIRSVFEDLTAITTSDDCRAGCVGGSGSCPDDWYPSGADTCSAACGAVYEPFCESSHEPQ